MKLTDQQREDLVYLVRHHKRVVRELAPKYQAKAIEAAALGECGDAELLLDFTNTCEEALECPAIEYAKGQARKGSR